MELSFHLIKRKKPRQSRGGTEPAMSMKKILRHRRLQRALVLYIDDELPQNETAQVRRHLESCAACRQKLVAIRACRELLQAGKPSLSVATEQLWQRIARKTAAQSQERFALGGIFSSANLRYLRWAAAAAMFLLFSLFVWKKGNEGERNIATPASAAIDYGIFLDDLRHNVSEANFHKRYPAQVVKLAEARQAIAFPLAQIEALPDSFRLECVRVLECNGKKCVQFTWSKAGKAINIFQHALGQPWTIGQYTSTRTPICNVECSPVNAKEVMAVSWQGENSEYLAIGALTPQELAQVVEVLQ